MEVERPTSAPASASKRKRDTLDITTYNEHGEEEHTPKRRRCPIPQSDIDADASDETTPAYQKNVRRKKGSRNLSNLNLRHAAEKAKTATVKSRKSKFIEGGFGDKPIEKPPSVFMRFIRTNSGNIKQVAQEDLMEDYHDGMPGSWDSVEKVIAQEKDAIPSRVAQIDSDKENKSEGGMFGKWASSLHPVALWNKVFAQTREEIIREDFEEAERKAKEEAERKAKEKAMYEAQYQEMKKAGMFKPKVIGNYFGSVSSRTTTETPRDSGIVIDEVSDIRESQEDQRAASQMSGLLPPPQDDTTSASEAPETASKPAKTLKSRLHLKKPSLTNISGSLKRAKSEFSLGQTLNHRESSSSISPAKTDFENSELKKSQSKHDLKKQHKLSKRVSDLESKLSQARKELDDALVEASPMPKLGSRYERFTPSTTLKRPKFIPGKLPSLPSERILMAQQQEQKNASDMKLKEDEDMTDADAATSTDLKEFLAEVQVKTNTNIEDGDGEETIKARAPHNRHQYPTRASSLFSLGDTNIENQSIESTEPIAPARPTSVIDKQPETSDLTEPTSSQVEEMDPNSIADLTTNGVVDQTTSPPDYATLDAKLKALDANVKKAAKAKKPAAKKRKSAGDGMDKAFKPNKGTEEDSEWEEEQTPKKKRKSTGGASGSPNSKKSSKFAISPKSKKATKKSPPRKGMKKIEVTETTEVEEYNADEGANVVEGDKNDDVDVDMPSTRTSLDSQMRPLEPVFEEIEEDEMAADTKTTSISVPLNDEPSKPTAKATPARHAGLSMNGLRSRSISPNKRPAPGAEEQMITRAAQAAKSNPARMRGRSGSPLPSIGVTVSQRTSNGHATAGAGAEDDQPVSAVLGEGGVPAMPMANGNGKVRGKNEGEKGDFVWPDDVF